MKSNGKIIGWSIALVAILLFLVIMMFSNNELSMAPGLIKSIKPEPLVGAATPAPVSPVPEEPRAAGRGLASVPDPLGAVDLIIEKLELGNIAFNTPQRLNIHDTAAVQLVLGFEEIDKLKQMIMEEGDKEGATIRVSERMEARLSGQNFSITAITPEIQAVSRKEPTEWKWEIEPTNEGRHSLHLTLSALLSFDGTSTPKAIRTFDKVIEVDITWPQQLRGFIKDNWQWMWATFLVPVAAWLWKRKKKQQPD